MYPLLLKPVTKDHLWGGTRLKTEYGIDTSAERIAEAWVLSCRKDGENIIENGELRGLTLGDALAKWGSRALGARAEDFEFFPMLIKLIDADKKLSVQVHPGDAYALENEGEYGKTEMWYVIDCKEGAQLIYGFAEKLGKDEFRRRATDGTLAEVCNFVPVKKGDVFFIPAGTLHAIGEGILIAEIQQNSNTTYRVYDYGRLGDDGKPRALHIDKALEVTRTEPSVTEDTVGETVSYPYGTVRKLGECEYFSSSLLELDGDAVLADGESFISLLLLDGSAELSCKECDLRLKKGDSVFIPCGLGTKLSGNARIILTHL